MITQTNNLKTYEPFKKRLYFSDVPKRPQFSVDINFSSDGRLSIIGDYMGGGGQIYEELGKVYPQEAGRLVAIWEQWHLNDMRPYCEHQRDWDTQKILFFDKYKMTSDAITKQRELKDRALADAQMSRSEKSSFNKRERSILTMPYSLTLPAGTKVGMLATLYQSDGGDSKAAGWVYPKDHPGGLLTKQCPVCDYHYGSAWLFEEVPADVIAELKAM